MFWGLRQELALISLSPALHLRVSASPPGTAAVQLLSRHKTSLHHDMTSSRFIAEEGFREASLHFTTAPHQGAPQSRGPSPCTLSLSPLSRMPCRTHPHPADIFPIIQASKPTHPSLRAAPKPEACNTPFLTPRCRLSSTLSNFTGKTCLLRAKPALR